MGEVVLRIVPFAEAQFDIRSIRYKVFHIEQGVALEIDFDGLDETSTHVVAYRGGQAIGTTRIRMLTQRLAKIERVAVLAAYRGQGLGKMLMQAAVEYLDAQAVPEIKLNAQMQVKAFYEKLGFVPYGEPFDEAGILHVEMRRLLQ